MTAPRWIVEDDGDYLSCGGYGLAPSRNIDVDANAYFTDRVFDALVAAVRDANTLTQARQLAAKARSRSVLDHWAVNDLLDLLAGDRP